MPEENYICVYQKALILAFNLHHLLLQNISLTNLTNTLLRIKFPPPTTQILNLK